MNTFGNRSIVIALRMRIAKDGSQQEISKA